MSQTVFTLVFPVIPAQAGALRARLNPSGDARQPVPGLPFDRIPALHFASLVIFDSQTVTDRPGAIGRLFGKAPRTFATAPRLAIECCIDGPIGHFLDALVHAAAPALIDILGHCLDFPDAPSADRPRALRAYLASHLRRPHLLHIGNPGLKADHIRAGHALRESLDAELDDLVRLGRSADPPLFIADALRRRLNVPPVPGAWHLSPPDAVRSDVSAALGSGPSWYADPVSMIGARVRHWLRLLLLVAVGGGLALFGAYRLWDSRGTVALLLAVAAVAITGRLAQRYFKGRHTLAVSRDDEARFRALKELEDFGAQNHMASLVVLKPGWIRRLRVRWVLASFELLYRTIFTDITPGRLRGLQTIHFAHWTVLDLLDEQGRKTGREALLFLSNYDGSWETYLDDFIAFLLGGVVRIWSNGEGFPWPLDGPTFKAWARACMSRWEHWYQAYPSLTVANIENNDLLRRGLIAPPRTEAEARRWLLRLGSARLGGGPMPPPGTLDVRDIQGLVFSGYRRLPYARYIPLRIEDAAAARAWLAAIAPIVTDGRLKRPEELARERVAINIALTHRGLARLGLDARVLDAFPAAFQEGMAPAGTRHRSRALGDVGASDPAGWRWGQPDKPVDILLMLYGADEADLAAHVRTHVDAFTARAGVRVDALEGLFLPAPEGVDPARKLSAEHFGFVDGVSQPILEGTYQAVRQTPATSSHLIKPGEFVLGYPAGDGTIAPGVPVDAALDPHGILPPVPMPYADAARTNDDAAGTAAAAPARDFGRNGTYLVFRQLAQDVAAFRAFTARAAGAEGAPHHPAAGARVAAQLVGRWRDGVPLAPLDATGRANNEFTFSGDAHGFACPIGSHVRRANPRDSLLDNPEAAQASTNRHRLLRRGRPYGPPLHPEAVQDDGAERGMVFMCLNGDIERQFEFVQQNWINNPRFGGLYDERDPLIGNQPDDGGRLTVQSDAVRERVAGVGRYVTVKSGGYFFLPGLSALRYLAHLDGSAVAQDVPTVSPALVGAGADAVARRTAVPAVRTPTLAFRLLSGVEARLPALRLLWAARFPLLLAAVLLMLPFVPGRMPQWLPPSAFVLDRWGLALVSLLASVAAFVVMIALRLVLLYGWRFGLGRARWTGTATWLQVFAFHLLALPIVVTAIRRSAEAIAAAAHAAPGAGGAASGGSAATIAGAANGAVSGTAATMAARAAEGAAVVGAARGGAALDPAAFNADVWRAAIDLAPAALAGGLVALVLLTLATTVQSLWRTGRPDLFFPPNPLIAGLAGPGASRAHVSRLAQRLTRLGTWIVDSVPEEIGRGYIDYRVRRVLPGHAFAAVLAVLTLSIYVIVCLWLAIAGRSYDAPALALVLGGAIVAAWILSAAAFFLDRYRLPTLLTIAVLLALAEAVRRLVTGG